MISLQPQVHTVPSDFNAALWQSPPETAITLARKPTALGPSTCTGRWLSLVLLLPSSPFVLMPQAHTLPSCLTATVCFQPNEICLTLLMPPTTAGVYRFLMPPSPN